MNCNRAQTLLALYAGGDLQTSEAAALNDHLVVCPACRDYHTGLERDQSLLRSLRRDSFPASALAEVRQHVLAKVESQERQPFVAFERWVLGALRAPRLAIAGLVLLGVVSVTLLAQVNQRKIVPIAQSPVFDQDNQMRQPEGYRQWVYVGAAVSSAHVDNSAVRVPNVLRSVYINPIGYEEYLKSGTFPEGTMMVAESAVVASKNEPGFEGWYEKGFVGLQVSVKDERFEGGWGYFDFTAEPGKLLTAAVPEGSACISCHRDRAATDHVFTQFYPVLKAAPRVL